MQINWKLKSAAFSLIDRFHLHKTLYFVQTYITRRAAIDLRAIDPVWQVHARHLAALPSARVLEFGAGKTLAQNIFLSRHVQYQLVVDLFHMLDLNLFNQAADQIARLLNEPAPSRHVKSIAEVLDSYRIDYRAPLDAGQTGLPDDSLDACVSTFTLEHIPRPDIVRIMTEVRRVVRPGGLVSAVIDYSDHYAHTDSSIGHLNFLQFDEIAFRRHNHSTHYQNRLRHYDFQRIFGELGFETLVDEPSGYVELPAVVDRLFDTTQPTVAATKGVFLLRVEK